MSFYVDGLERAEQQFHWKELIIEARAMLSLMASGIQG
jgi:hypothetical protein